MVGVRRFKSSKEAKVGDTVYFVDRDALNTWPHLRDNPGIVVSIINNRNNKNDNMTRLKVKFEKETQSCFYFRFGKLLECEITGRPMVIGEL